VTVHDSGPMTVDHTANSHGDRFTSDDYNRYKGNAQVFYLRLVDNFSGDNIPRDHLGDSILWDLLSGANLKKVIVKRNFQERLLHLC
jgi:hypothetical protein